VEDDANKQWLLAHYAEKAIPNSECILCSNGAEAIEHLKLGPVDAIVTDHSMQPVTGIELIRWARSHAVKAPIVMMTGYSAIEADAMEAGATQVVSTYRFSEIGEILLPLLQKSGGT
jgi:DNA-binding NtrC family response regulator